MTSVRPFCFILQGLLLVGFYQVESGNVLVIPGEFSHWHNMRVIVEELVERNHSVTVLVSTASNTVKYAKEEGFRFQFFSVSHEEHEFSAMWDEMTDIWVQYQNSTILHTVSRVIDLMKNVSAFEICEAMIKNETVMGTLRQSKFDVVLYDPFIVCGDLLADMLNVPLIIVMKMFFGYTLERICGQMPSTPSYIPTHPVRFSDRMNFPERVQNFLQYVMLTTIFYTLSHVQLNPMYSEIKGLKFFGCCCGVLCNPCGLQTPVSLQHF
uniref:Uncharacterized protein n=1 Tax=Denticeps clupeoides TaxID=299321 RepID=A0AAY4DQE5_9TELE